jgi:hypothetical protein
MNSGRTSGDTAATGVLTPTGRRATKRKKGVDIGPNQTADHGWGNMQNTKKCNNLISNKKQNTRTKQKKYI